MTFSMSKPVSFFNDLFAQLEQITKEMTAYEVAARNSEKLQVLGPVIERLQNEALAPAIKRIFNILFRKNLLPPLPPSLQGIPLGIEYVGILALAQKAAKTASLERFAQTMDVLQQQHPEVADCWSVDAWAAEFGQELFVPSSVMNDPKKIAALRQIRAKQAQAQATLAAAQSASQTGKNLGQIPVGGGMQASELMSGLGGGMTGAQPVGGG